MIFTLEALQADHGDSLLVHAGSADEPLLILVDGGPTGVYANSLRPRLEELREQRAPGGALEIDLAMLSHIDDDHINGLIDMAGELVEAANDQRPQPYAVGTLWHNSFDDITGNESDDFRAIALDALEQPPPQPAAEKARTSGLAVVASVTQGRTLRDQAATLGWPVNAPFDGLVIAPEEGTRTITLGEDTKITVVCPHVRQLKRLHKEWEQWLDKRNKREAAAVAAYADNSVFNLASIVVLVEAGGKRMLLCGDARGDHVLEGLQAAGLVEGGVTELDLLKLPHHGSIHNVEADFFKRLPARHYVVSANGRDGNPETETLTLIADSRDDDDFTIHLTNRSGKGDLEQRLTAFIADQQAKGRRFGVTFRDKASLSLRIDLGDETP
jgi:beta-lactamase superfamily II metal-dependent hydrolase